MDASNRTHSDLVDMIMGPPGSMVELEVEKEGSGSRATMEIKRETTARREAGMAQRSEMSFDPTEFGGSDSDSEEGDDSDDGGGGDYGIGVKVSKDERGFFRITEVVLGGAADIGGLLKVGDIVRSVGGKTVTVDLRRSDVMDLIRGQPGTIVSVEYVRDGKIHKADVQVGGVKLLQRVQLLALHANRGVPHTKFRLSIVTIRFWSPGGDQRTTSDCILNRIAARLRGGQRCMENVVRVQLRASRGVRRRV